MLGIFRGIQMKFRSIFFSFLKTWLLVAIFYSGSLYAGYMHLNLNDYHPTTNNFRPYLFERDLNTGKLVQVFDTENSFQFETYSLDSDIDMILYEMRVLPVLQDWGAGIGNYQPSTDSHASSDLAKVTESEVNLNLKGEGGIPSTREIHIATYKGEIEAISYSDSSEMETPEIITLIAKPEGLVPGQTTNIKGGGSSLLEQLIQDYKAKNVQKIRLYSSKDDYYSKRGWEDETDSEGACGSG